MMKNKITFALYALLMTVIISSCSTSSDVASNRKIQKRKYNKGLFVSKNKKFFGKTNDESKDVLNIQNEFAEVAEISASVKNESFVSNVKEESNEVIQLQTIKNSSVVENGTESNFSSSNDVIESTKVEGEELIDVKKDLKTKLKRSSKKKKSAGGGVHIIILVILALFIPPLAVFLYEGITTRFWIDLLLALLAIGGFIFIGGLAGLAGLLAVIYALLIVLEVI